MSNCEISNLSTKWGQEREQISGTGDKMRPLTWLTWSAIAALWADPCRSWSSAVVRPKHAAVADAREMAKVRSREYVDGLAAGYKIIARCREVASVVSRIVLRVCWMQKTWRRVAILKWWQAQLGTRHDLSAWSWLHQLYSIGVYTVNSGPQHRSLPMGVYTIQNTQRLSLDILSTGIYP